MSLDDHVLHIEPEQYKTEIPDGDTWYDLRVVLQHTLKVSELLGAAAKVLPRIQYVDVEVRTWSWGKIRMTHFEMTHRDNRIWIGKNSLNTAFFHYFSREN
jgi:hypothetical protein